MKLKIVSAAALIAAGAMSGTAAMADGHAACGEVSITEMDWASAAVVTAVSKFLMEQGYGCEVQVVHNLGRHLGEPRAGWRQVPRLSVRLGV